MTTEEIFNDIITEKDSGAYPELDTLNATSKVSIWRLFVYIMSFLTKLVTDAFDSLQVQLRDLFAKNQVGTLDWWLSKLYQFQYEDSLELIDGVYKYSNIDSAKQIVKRAALELLNYVLLFKVAAEDNEGNLIPLTPVQHSALLAYINKIKLPGTYVGLFSGNADNIKINLRVYYNPEISESELTTNITSGIKSYLNNIVYNGKFIINDLTDTLQLIDGVVNPVIKAVYVKADSSPEISYNLIDDYYNSFAGYYQLTELNIDYIPYV